MKSHLRLIETASDAELRAVLASFEIAADALGLLPDERRALVSPGRAGRVDAREAERQVRQLIAIAADAAAMLGDEDLVREWLRRPNAGLRDPATGASATPIDVMLGQPDGVRAIVLGLEEERRCRFPRCW